MMSEPCTSNDQAGLLSFARSGATVGSGCGESSNPADAVTFISCHGYDSGSLLEEKGGTPINLEFNYELFTADGVEDVEGAIGEFEGGLLGGVADTLGLLSCAGSTRKKEGRRANMRGLMSEPVVMGVSSEPADTVSDVECTTKMLDTAKLIPVNCAAVNGYMTAWLPASSGGRKLSETDIYDAIENFISKGFTSDSVFGVSYIPPETEATEPVITKTVSEFNAESYQQDDKANMSWDIPPAIGLLAVACTLLALVGVARVVKKRRSRSTEEGAEVSPSDIETDVEPEIPSQPPTPQKQVGFMSDTDDASSVATEDYTTDNYVQDEFIRRMPTYGSAWGDRTRTIQSEAMSTFSRERSGYSRADDESVASMPSEMGEEIGIECFK